MIDGNRDIDPFDEMTAKGSTSKCLLAKRCVAALIMTVLGSLTLNAGGDIRRFT